MLKFYGFFFKVVIIYTFYKFYAFKWALTIIVLLKFMSLIFFDINFIFLLRKSKILLFVNRILSSKSESNEIRTNG